jgi:hypothetical protein
MLDQLNKAVDDAIATRKKWMDDHMVDYAKFQVGDEIYDGDTGRRLGVVTRLYRYHADRNPLLDRHMSIDYEFCVGKNMFDNTSRHLGRRFGVRRVDKPPVSV